MADTLVKTKIVADLRPAYYDDFQCLAQDCQISCCKGWHISFDRKDYLSLRQQHGSEELNQCMQKSLRRLKNTSSGHYAEFAMRGDACPLLAEDGLCLLQKEKGHEALPLVCKIFPRLHTYTFSGYYERSLSPACEAVLELLWNLPQGIDFVSDPLPNSEQSTKFLPPPDENPFSLVAHFQDIRSLCIDLLQDRRFTMAQRILLMGLYLQKLTAEEEVDIAQWLENTAAALAHPDAPKIAAQLTIENEKNIQLTLFNHLKVLRLFLGISDTDTFSTNMRKNILETLVLTQEFVSEDTSLHITVDLAKFSDARTRFLADFKEDEYFFENLAVTIFFHKHFPNVTSSEELWKSYVDFCNVYSFFRFIAICSYMEPAADAKAKKDALFRGIVFASHSLLHNHTRQNQLRDEFFNNENSSLAHMKTLLSL